MVEFIVDNLPRRIGVMPGDYFLYAARERNRRREIRYKTFDLCVVEDHAAGLVTEKLCAPLRTVFDYNLRRNMDDLRSCAGGPRRKFVDLIPRQQAVRCDVKNFADRRAIA